MSVYKPKKSPFYHYDFWISTAPPHPLFGRMLSPCPDCGWDHYEKVHCFQGPKRKPGRKPTRSMA